jgi:hypothetical protein
MDWVKQKAGRVSTIIEEENNTESEEGEKRILNKVDFIYSMNSNLQVFFRKRPTFFI